MSDERFQYEVFITPLSDINTYGTEINVSDFISVSGIPTIKQNIDAGDYDIGVFTYGDIKLKAENVNGKFNDETDIRSIFQFSRDLAKVRIEFKASISNADKTLTETSTVTYKGLINEEATRTNTVKEQVDFKVLSLDSVIRTEKVAAGIITNGSTVKVALESILDTAKITSVLGFSAANINPDSNYIIDDGSVFDSLITRDALNQLLLTSNSIFVIDSNDNMIIKDRVENLTTDVLILFGKSDFHGRENIVSIKKYNSGKQRMFNSVQVNDLIKTNAALQATFGVRTKIITADHVTDADTEAIIANNLLDEFEAPKIELEINVPTNVAKAAILLDRVSINYPLRVVKTGDFFPVVGITEIGEASNTLPDTFGSLSISPDIAFKIIEKKEIPNKFITTLKLRQVGKSLSDGTFSISSQAIVGFAIIGESEIGVGTESLYNPSVIGAALIGDTETA